LNKAPITRGLKRSLHTRQVGGHATARRHTPLSVEELEISELVGVTGRLADSNRWQLGQVSD
jgi:hypothetical protein